MAGGIQKKDRLRGGSSKGRQKRGSSQLYRWINGEEAWAMGLVNHVVPREKLLPMAEEMARKIASYDYRAVRNAKQAVVRGLDLTLPEGLDLEKRLASQLSPVKNRNVRGEEK